MKLYTKTEFMKQNHIGYKQLQEMIDNGQIEMVGKRIKVIETYENKIVLDTREYTRLKEIEVKYNLILGVLK
jgi:hypothetical protein